MLEYNKLLKLYEAFDELLFLPDITSRKYRYEKLLSRYQYELDIILSYSMELPKIQVIPLRNNYTNFDYKIDFGNLVYHILNEVKYQPTYITLPYPIQKLIYLILNKTIITKLGEDYLLLKMDKYYKLSELILELEIPEVISKAEIGLQGLKRDKINIIKFPIYLYQIPNNLKYKQLQYFIKKDGKFISNINSGVVREYLRNNIKEFQYGIIGMTTKVKGFKRKYQFIPLYFNTDPTNITNLYQNKGDIYNNQLEELNLENQAKLVTINSEEELKSFISKKRKKVSYVVLSDNGVELFKPDIEYVNCKVLDYIYNDYYEAIGLIIQHLNKTYEIYFNVMETNYIDGIDNKYVRISVVKYKGVILNVYYNSELGLWSKISNECKVCGKTDSKHNRDGICNSCIYKFEKYVEVVNRECVVSCGSEFDTIIKNYRFKSDGSNLVVSCVGVVQQNLDLFEENLC